MPVSPTPVVGGDDQVAGGAGPWPGLTPQGPVQDMIHAASSRPVTPEGWGRDVDMLAALLPPARSRELLHHVATRTFTFLVRSFKELILKGLAQL